MRPTFLAPFAVLAALSVACVSGPGEELVYDLGTVDEGVDTAFDTAPAVDSGPPVIVGPYGDGGCPSPCPYVLPKGGDACPANGLECEYGGQFDPKCNIVARCVTDRWTIVSPSGACPGVATGCPSSPFGPERGRPCAPAGAVCTYVDGICDCQRESAGTTATVWACTAFTCKGPRPRLGCTCTSALVCQYGGCTGEIVHGLDLACRDSVWKRPDTCK